MTAETRNKKALMHLNRQEWLKAQKLFFENARKNPSHQTYNNLGYYLVTEGLALKNGKSRNALSLGKKYLLKARELEYSAVNANAIVYAIDCQLRNPREDEIEKLFAEALLVLENALEKEYNYVLEYNYLCFKYRSGSITSDILLRAQSLVSKKTSHESVSLCFEFLRYFGLIEEGIDFINKYRKLIEPTELLMFYAKYGMYDKGYELCESICKCYDISSNLAAAISECCTNMCYSDKFNYIELLDNHNLSEAQRKALINDYISVPPILVDCYYFGCPIHNTKW